MTQRRLVALTLVLFQSGCTSLCDGERPVGAPDPSIPTADVTVEVEELPGLFEVTERQ